MTAVLEGKENQICEFLASGHTAVEVAGMVSVEITFIQNLLNDASFRDLVKARGAELRTQRIEHKYARTEEKILDHIVKEAEDGMADTAVLIRALEVVAKNRVLYRNPSGINPGQTFNINSVTLMLPERAKDVDKIMRNSNNEIIAINGRNMASMPIDGVKEIFTTFEKAKNPQNDQGQQGQDNGLSTFAVPTAASA